MGAMMVLESLIMWVLAMMIGKIHHTALASYQSVSQLSAIFYMIPFGMSQAMAILASRSFAHHDLIKTYQVALIGSLMTAILLAILAGILYSWPGYFVTFFFHEKGAHVIWLIHLAKQMLVITGFYLIFDGIRLALIGALRGMRDVWIPFVISVISFWVVTIILAYYWGFHTHAGILGIWWALAVGVIFSFVAVIIRYFYYIKKIVPLILAGKIKPHFNIDM